MDAEKLAPHVQEISRALGDRLSEEEIAEELQHYIDLYRLSIPEAKRTIVKKHGGDASAFTVGFQRKLAELRPSEPNVDFVAKVLSVNSKEVSAKGEQKTILYGFMGDDTTTLPYTVWQVEEMALEKGDVVSVRGAYTTEYKGRVQLNFGNRVSVKKEDPSTIEQVQIATGPPRAATASELRGGMGFVEVKARILSVEGREVTVQGEQKKIFSGVMADGTGKIGFTAWSDFKLKPGEVVRVSKATVKSWRGIPELNFDERADLIRVKEKFPSAEELARSAQRMIGEIAASGGAADVTIRGVMIEVRDGSGLIMRCPECKRALQKGTCKVHGRVEGYPDLRIKAILDDGTGAVSAVMNRETTERLLDTTLDECMQKAKEAMNFDVIKDMIDERLTLKAYDVTGNVTSDAYGLSMIASGAKPAASEVKKEVEKLLVDLEEYG